jgi:hypothetical protein
MDQLHPSGEKLFLSAHPRFIKSLEEPKRLTFSFTFFIVHTNKQILLFFQREGHNHDTSGHIARKRGGIENDLSG